MGRFHWQRNLKLFIFPLNYLFFHWIIRWILMILIHYERLFFIEFLISIFFRLILNHAETHKLIHQQTNNLAIFFVRYYRNTLVIALCDKLRTSCRTLNIDEMQSVDHSFLRKKIYAKDQRPIGMLGVFKFQMGLKNEKCSLLFSRVR